MNFNFMKYIGRFSLGNKIMISDPCYYLGATWQGTIENITPGYWDAYIETVNTDYHGVKVSKLMIVHIDYNDEYAGVTQEDINIKQHFNIGADSGVVGIFDYDYYCKYHDESGVDKKWYTEQIYNPLIEDGEKSEFTEFEGVVSLSGYGDGCYDCFICKNNKEEIVGVKIIYIHKD